MTGIAIHGPSGTRPPQPVPDARSLGGLLAFVAVVVVLVICLTHPFHALIASVGIGGVSVRETIGPGGQSLLSRD